MLNDPSISRPRLFEYSPEQISRLRIALSEDRFARYLHLANGIESAAIQFYERNAALSESLYGVLQGFEILLRNAMHASMSEAAGTDLWFDRLRLERQEMESVAKARAKISGKGKPETGSRIVAELTFGFWSSLASRRYATTLWVPHLRKAFPHRALGHQTVFQRLNSIRLLRNMVAHHECVLSRDLIRDYRDVIESASWICPHTASWIRQTTRFETVYLVLYQIEVLPGIDTVPS